MSILIVDDDPDFSVAPKEVLQDEYPLEVVTTAADGAAALALLRQSEQPPATVLLDSALPGEVTAADVRDYIRRAPHLRDVSVIMIGAASESSPELLGSMRERIRRFRM